MRERPLQDGQPLEKHFSQKLLPQFLHLPTAKDLQVKHRLPNILG